MGSTLEQYNKIYYMDESVLLGSKHFYNKKDQQTFNQGEAEQAIDYLWEFIIQPQYNMCSDWLKSMLSHRIKHSYKAHSHHFSFQAFR